MRCVELLYALSFLYSVAAEFNYNLLQSLENAREDPIISDSCQQALQLYQDNLQSTTGGWAFRMFDATSKVPVGLLSLNMGDMGQFTQCLTTESPDGLIQPRYCLGLIPLGAAVNPAMGNGTITLHKKLRHMWLAARSIANLRSAQEAETTNVATGIRWAICLPTDCSAEDIEEILGSVVDSISVSCQTKEDLSPPLTDGAIATIVVLAFFTFLLVFSTAIDLYYKMYIQKEPPHVILIAFSVYSNGQKLLRISHNANELTCLNGIRFLSMLWVLVGHVVSTYINLPVTNYIDVSNWADKWRSMTILSTLSVDTFFVLSGLLVVYSYMKAKHHGVKFNIFQFYIHRYLRLTPALAIVVLVTANLLRYIGSGPVWSNMEVLLEKPCQKYWWSTLLYVQNYVNTNDNCLTQTWYLSVDMQLYILSPLILYPLWKYPKIGMGLVVLGIGGSIATGFSVAYINELPALMSNFNAQAKILDYVEKYYYTTHCRAASWLIGVVLGYILATIKFQGKEKHLKLHKVVMFLMWILCIAVIGTCVYAGHNTLRGEEFDKWGNTLYIAFVKPAWCIALAFLIFACVSGYGGPINWILSLPIYQVLNRFTYSVYLIHYPLICLHGNITKTGLYFDEFTIAWWFGGLTMYSFLLSVVSVLAFESPVVILEKLIFGGGKKINKVEDSGSKNTQPA